MKSKSEHELQKQIVRYFRLKKFRVFLLDAMTGVGYFPANDGRRFAFIRDLKDRGYEKGQPDICVVRNKVIFIELKKKGGRESTSQHDIRDWLQSHGHIAFIVDNFEDAQKIADNPLN